jgi:hypothetical protein
LPGGAVRDRTSGCRATSGVVPPLQHGVLIAAFIFGMLTCTARVASFCQAPAASSYLVAFATAFLLILQRRILDEPD